MGRAGAVLIRGRRWGPQCTEGDPPVPLQPGPSPAGLRRTSSGGPGSLPYLPLWPSGPSKGGGAGNRPRSPAPATCDSWKLGAWNHLEARAGSGGKVSASRQPWAVRQGRREKGSRRPAGPDTHKPAPAWPSATREGCTNLTRAWPASGLPGGRAGHEEAAEGGLPAAASPAASDPGVPRPGPGFLMGGVLQPGPGPGAESQAEGPGCRASAGASLLRGLSANCPSSHLCGQRLSEERQGQNGEGTCGTHRSRVSSLS